MTDPKLPHQPEQGSALQPQAFGGNGAVAVRVHEDALDQATLETADGGVVLHDAFPHNPACFNSGANVVTSSSGGTSSTCVSARARMTAARSPDSMRQFMQRFDLLVTPSVAVPAFEAQPAGHSPMSSAAMLGWTPFSYPFNLTQQPASTVPCGLTAAGLPIGLQFVGPMFGDALVLRASRAYEAARPADVDFKRPVAIAP